MAQPRCVPTAAFIEEDYSRRYRIGIEVPLHERIALGIRPAWISARVSGQPFAIGLGLRSYVTPYTLHGAEAQVSWRLKLLDASARRRRSASALWERPAGRWRSDRVRQRGHASLEMAAFALR